MSTELISPPLPPSTQKHHTAANRHEKAPAFEAGAVGLGGGWSYSASIFAFAMRSSVSALICSIKAM
jgi:hypothetical protein